MRFIIDSMMDQETAAELKAKEDELANLKIELEQKKSENESLKEKLDLQNK